MLRRLLLVLAVALGCGAQEKVGPLSGMRLPVWDWTQPGTNKYIFLIPVGEGVKVEKAADGVSWELRIAAAPGTASAKLLRFVGPFATEEIVGTNIMTVYLDTYTVMQRLGSQPQVVGSVCNAQAGAHVTPDGYYVCAPPKPGSGDPWTWKKLLWD